MTLRWLVWWRRRRNDRDLRDRIGDYSYLPHRDEHTLSDAGQTLVEYVVVIAVAAVVVGGLLIWGQW